MKARTNVRQSSAFPQPSPRSHKELQECRARRCLMFHSPSADAFGLWTCGELQRTRRRGGAERKMKTGSGKRQKVVRFSRRRMCFLRRKSREGTNEGVEEKRCREGGREKKDWKTMLVKKKGSERDSDGQIKREKINSGALLALLCW